MSGAKHRFPYEWRLSDGYPAPGLPAHGATVFGTFICGGGSTMGYKLAGYNHLGGVEIDPEVAAVYAHNHHPRHLFTEDIRAFRVRPELPPELFDLDIFDGSPPCSTFSTAGAREKGWGAEKMFREGQSKQRLDDLFFEHIALANRLQPKVVLAENVTGLIKGNARAYVVEIKKQLDAAGYRVQLFLLNAASMGVPQKRERVFFVCSRKELGLPLLRLSFSEPAIPYGQIKCLHHHTHGGPVYRKLWEKRKPGDECMADISRREEGRLSGFNTWLLRDDLVVNTLVSGSSYYTFDGFGRITKRELCLAGSYPLDYAFSTIDPKYLIGMSVPPVMTAQIAHQIYLQWLSKQ